ncbi:MAG TPA: D-alanyl-D-alanine carboxypeptidase [Clostridiales bacterium]|nr:D-alanyl-D-alanine carboxypeptidase [Clostridiales bacterium]
MLKKIAVLLGFIMLLSHNSTAAAMPSVSAQSAIIINAATGTVLGEYNARTRLPMASTTKIMTALILAEQPNLDKTVVTTREMVMVEGSSMGLKVGDTVSYRALLYGMMLASGNDAANTTAIAIAGSIEEFAKMMNAKAREIGMKDTNFVTPSGLDHKDHYTTAYDLAILTAYAMKNPEFRAAAQSVSAEVYFGNPPYKRYLRNHNRLLTTYDGCIGVKTGFTKKSGRCLVSAASRDNKEVIAVTLNAPDDWNDHMAMLDFGLSCLENYELEVPLSDDTIPVISGEADRVRLEIEKVRLGLTGNEHKNITAKVHLPEFIYAPISRGDIVGYIEYLLDGKTITRANIKAAADMQIKPPEPKSFLERLVEQLRLLSLYI